MSAVTPQAILSHAALIAAGFGYLASWAAEILKQDRLKKWQNTLLADGLIVVGALVIAVVHVPAGANLTWGAFASTLFFAAVTALANHYGFLLPTGIGPALQTLTSVKPHAPAPTPAPPATPATPAGNVAP